MINNDYDKIVKHEKFYCNIALYGSAIILFSILLLVVLTHNNFDMVFYFIISGTLGTTIVFLLLFNKYFLRNYSPDILFDKIGHEKLILRYNNLISAKKDFLKFFVIFVIFFGLVLYARASIITDPSLTDIQADRFLFGLITIPGMILYALQITIARFNRRSSFYFFQCACSFEIITKYPTIKSEEKSRLIYYGLSSYDDYLRLILKRHITNLNLFYLKILASSDDSMCKIITEINQLLQPTDKLKFLRYLTSLYGEQKPDFLAEDIVSRKIIEIIGLVLGPIITILIFVISILIEKPFVS